MESTSLEALIAEALSPDRERALAASKTFFTQVVEPLADAFSASAVQTYVSLFGPALRDILPELAGVDIEARYRRVSLVRRVHGNPGTVIVLSRVTLGADVNVTSVVLDAAKRRFPNSNIVFAGPAKNAELFASDSRITRREIAYPRSGSLHERLAAWKELRELCNEPDVLVLDPDSRMTQLGLLPLGQEDRYHLFESRSYGGESSETLVELTARWVAETLDIEDARPFIASPHRAQRFRTTVSFGVGENVLKRAGDLLESEILKYLPGPVLIDRGSGGEEAARVERAVHRSGAHATMFDGSFAEFASHIARSGFYLGYDSAGGHVAAAYRVPMVSIFAGFTSDRMFERWKPHGTGPIRVVKAPADDLLAVAVQAVKQVLGSGEE